MEWFRHQQCQEGSSSQNRRKKWGERGIFSSSHLPGLGFNSQFPLAPRFFSSSHLEQFLSGKFGDILWEEVTCCEVCKLLPPDPQQLEDFALELCCRGPPYVVPGQWFSLVLPDGIIVKVMKYQTHEVIQVTYHGRMEHEMGWPW